MFDSHLLALLGVGLLAGFLLRRTYRRIGRRKSEPAIARVPRPVPQRRRLMDAPPEIAQYEVQLHETARELLALLDSKIVALQVLTQQAQQKIDRLERLLSQLDSGMKPEPPEPNPPHYEGEHAEIHALADQGFSAVTIAHRTHTALDEVQRILAARQ